MKPSIKSRYPLAAIVATGMMSTALCFGQISLAQAQEPAPPPVPGQVGAPPPPPAPSKERGSRRGPDRGPLEGPESRGEQPPQRPGKDQPPIPPLDPQKAAVAVKTATDAVTGFVPGQVWMRTAPRGEQQMQATILFQNKEVARLEFDPANGSVMMRGEKGGPAEPPIPPNANAPVPPVPPAQITDNANGGPSVPIPPSRAPAPSTQADLNQVKDGLPATIKALSVGQGAEILDREGFWKVPLIYQNRVVAELHLSADGTKLIQDFAAARDAAIFAR